MTAAQQRKVSGSLAAARQQRHCQRWWQQRDSATVAVAAAQQRNVGNSLTVAWWRRQRQRRWRQRQMRWRGTARRRQCGGSSAEAAVDFLAPSVNVPTHAPSNATDAPTYTSLSLVKDRGTTAPTASLLLAAAAAVPVATSTAVADASPPPMTTPPPTTPPTPTATPTTSFVKLNLI